MTSKTIENYVNINDARPSSIEVRNILDNHGRKELVVAVDKKSVGLSYRDNLGIQVYSRAYKGATHINNSSTRTIGLNSPEHPFFDLRLIEAGL